MAINLASKYSGKIAEKFTKESFVAGNASKEYDFAGVRSISVYTPLTVNLNDYKRQGNDRFGETIEMEDTVQEMELTQDKGFSISIDRGNNIDQMNTKGAGKMLNMQIRERVVPFMDKYTIKKWSHDAGQIAGLSSAPTKDTIASVIFDGAAALDNALVPDADRLLYLPSTYYNALRLSKEFLAVDKLAEKSLVKGLVGMVADMKVIKVPDSYFPDGLYFLITHKNSVLNPNKIKTMRVLSDVKGIDGHVLEGRNYFDAFVLGAKADGVYAAIEDGKQTALPVIALTGASAAITAVSGVTFYYTTDGTDPRYSKSAQVYSAEVTLAAGQTIKAYGKKDGEFPSGVSEKTYTA
ncbi:chitobiase/beta-hexosaminidase C-terminal domain-containing protein [Christensenella minuta]|uniref:chitobiase/beta-hexosaminidase C-terminal domain-containing protein n=1 Tax=Christensenella minuta TaxID=626937 RepID=UPI002157DC26|nr:chitobiase/beta-hexosaminidase C-terminal domain-containing protein [Christensenella minuta]